MWGDGARQRRRGRHLSNYRAYYVKEFQDFHGVQLTVPGDMINIPVSAEHNASLAIRCALRERRRDHRREPIVIYRWAPVPGQIRMEKHTYTVLK